MEVMQVLHMNKGEGETSYAKNSVVQRKIISVANIMVEEAIAKILRDSFPESLGVADLGCSSGPNTLTVVSEIIRSVYVTSHQMCRSIPELRVSLNDLPGNDFNDVFLSLPEFYQRMKHDYGIEHCFVSGMPGSFYGRLFPTRSLHFVHSSSSLHWLSQVPSGLEPTASVHLNKGKLFISKSSPPSVLDAYKRQYQEDFSVFLRSRSEEMVAGGRMVLSFMGRRSPDPCADEGCYQWELLARALMSMALDGLIEEEKIDSFNAPYYAPCLQEVHDEVAKEGSFIVDRLESFEIEWDGGGSSNESGPTPTELSSGLRVAKTIRAVVESMLESHFHMGTELMDVLFRRYAEIVDDHFSRTRTKYIDLVISFVKKG